MPAKRKELKIEGQNLWYLVGLITSDGCLSGDGRHIDITSSDHEFLVRLRSLLGFTNKVTVKYGSKRKEAFHIQIGNKNFYNFLLSIGLTPKKSLTIKSVDVSRKYFVDFLRGMIDGDGGIQSWVHSINKHEQWNLRVSSGSKEFLEWLRKETQDILGVKGRLYSQSKTSHRLKYGKMAAKIISKKCYYDGAFALQRKAGLAKACINSYSGWDKSETIVN